MQDFPAYLPIYSLVSRSEATRRRFYELVLTKGVVHSLCVAVVRAKTHERQGRAGNDTLIVQDQCGRRYHWSYQGTREGLALWLTILARSVDLILVESEEKTGLPQILLDGGSPAGAEESINLYEFDEDPDTAAQSISHHLQEKLARKPVWACVLIGGRSSRMGQAKHLLVDKEGTTWLERAVRTVQPHVSGIVLSGLGKIPSALKSLGRLPDIPQVAGPLTGILSAMRWQPDVSWLLLACDMPEVSSEAVSWLLAERKIGQWASVPVIQGAKGAEPLFASYEPQCAAFFEQMCVAGIRRISTIVEFDRVATIPVPDYLHGAWQNINTPEEFKRFIS